VLATKLNTKNNYIRLVKNGSKGKIIMIMTRTMKVMCIRIGGIKIGYKVITRMFVDHRLDYGKL